MGITNRHGSLFLICINLRVGLIGGGDPPTRNNRDYPPNRGFKFQAGFKQVGSFRINTNEFPECRECAGDVPECWVYLEKTLAITFGMLRRALKTLWRRTGPISSSKGTAEEPIGY